jgi:hypothetical protein
MPVTHRHVSVHTCCFGGFCLATWLLVTYLSPRLMLSVCKRDILVPKNINFAYVGKRVTGTKAGDYLITRRGWQGAVPQGMAQISSPNNSVLVIGRVFVDNDSDLPTAYGLAKQIQLIHK